MFCESCGAPNDEGSKFCENCGAPLQPSQHEKANSGELSSSPVSSAKGGKYGKIGIVVGILSIILFFFFILGPIAIIIGYFSYSAGDVKYGKIAMVLGAVGLFLSLLPLVLLI